MDWKRSMGIAHVRHVMPFRKAPSLVDLCVEIAIDKARYLGDVGETDLHLLDRILPHCTRDQLLHVENCTVGRDLSPVTDKLWKQFYKKDFGERSFNLVIERMKEKKLAFRWKQLYEAKTKDVNEAETKAVDRLKQLYQTADARFLFSRAEFLRLQIGKTKSADTHLHKGSTFKQQKKLRGPGYGLSGVKSNIMKKAKLDLLKSQEVKNLAAMRKNAVQRSYSGVSRKDSASSSKQSKPLGRKF